MSAGIPVNFWKSHTLVERVPCTPEVASRTRADQVPTLVQRSDGAYIVRDFYHEHNQTWQLTAKGVEFLRAHGFDTGSTFPRSLLWELVEGSMAYTQGQPRIQEPGSPPWDDVDLNQRAWALYQALQDTKLADAYTFLLPRIRGRMTVEQFQIEFAGSALSRGLSSWRFKRVSSVAQESSELGVTRVGEVIVDLEFQDVRDNLYERLELWFQIGGEWYWLPDMRQGRPVAR